LEDFDFMLPPASLPVAVAQRFVRFSAHPQPVQQDG
jgi:hypothetical protein